MGTPNGAMGAPKGGDVGGPKWRHCDIQWRRLWGHPKEVTLGTPKGAMGAPKGGDDGAPNGTVGTPKAGDDGGTQGSHGDTQGR